MYDYMLKSNIQYAYIQKKTKIAVIQKLNEET